MYIFKERMQKGYHVYSVSSDFSFKLEIMSRKKIKAHLLTNLCIVDVEREYENNILIYYLSIKISFKNQSENLSTF